MKLFVMLACSFLPLSSQAENLVLDPSGILNQADTFLGTPAWKGAFGLKDQAVFKGMIERCEFECQNQLGGPLCASSCVAPNPPVLVTHTVGVSNDQEVQIFSDDGQNLSLTAERFSQINGNRAREFLAHVGEFVNHEFTAKVSSIASTTFNPDPTNPVYSPLSAINLSGTLLLLDGSGTFEWSLTLVKGVPVVAQVARFRVGESTWFRLSAFSKGSP